MKTVRIIQPQKLIIKPKKKVCAYVRVSLEKDTMLQSMSAQVSYYSNYIQKNPEWEFAGIYVDKAVTGTKVDREQFQRMLNDCRHGEVDLILTKSISRFARNTVTMLETVRELKLLGIDIYFEKENIHSISGDGELMLTILSSYAQEESRSVSENCKWQIRKRFQNGEPVNWRCMYGYRIENGEISVNRKEAEVVKSIFNDYINGVPVVDIVKELIRRKVPLNMGGEWRYQRIYQILNNEKYTGNSLLQKKYVVDHISKKEVINKGELPKYYAENTHPAIIDIDTFKKVQELLKANRERNKGKTKCRTYPFTGMIKCAHCGKNYKRKTTKSGIVWNCNTYLSKGITYCHTKQIPEETLYQITSEVLSLKSFDEIIFKNKIKQIIIPEFNYITFIFNEGTKITKTWSDKSRSDSWTPEMREAARQRRINKSKEHS